MKMNIKLGLLYILNLIVSTVFFTNFCSPTENSAPVVCRIAWSTLHSLSHEIMHR